MGSVVTCTHWKIQWVREGRTWSWRRGGGGKRINGECGSLSGAEVLTPWLPSPGAWSSWVGAPHSPRAPSSERFLHLHNPWQRQPGGRREGTPANCPDKTAPPALSAPLLIPTPAKDQQPSPGWWGMGWLGCSEPPPWLSRFSRSGSVRNARTPADQREGEVFFARAALSPGGGAPPLLPQGARGLQGETPTRLGAGLLFRREREAWGWGRG